MIRTVRRATLLVAFYVLTSAATASAECAWVLWVTGTPTDGTQGEYSSPWNSYKSIEECKSDLLSAPMKKLIAESKRVRLFPVCLPDTVDPRGPKGK